MGRGEAVRRPTHVTVGPSFDCPTEAERAAAALRSRRVVVVVERVMEIICPGNVRRTRWVLSVARDDVRLAERILSESS